MNSLFNTLRLLKAYEKAINENIICSITDTSGNIIYVNKKFCEAAKYTYEELIGQNHRIVNSGHHPKTFFKTLWQTIESGHVWRDEIMNRAKDNSIYWVDTVIVPIKDENCRITHYLSLLTLITERKSLEKKNKQYLSSLEVLLVMTASKVKKPLTTCLKQLNAFDPAKLTSKNDFKSIVDNLKLSANEFSSFTKELETFIRNM